MKTLFKKIIVYILRIESKLVLSKYKPKVIAITGSVGKTSTKDAIYAVLSKISHVRKSEKSYNSEIGLPLTILGLPNGWHSPLIWCQNVFKGLWLFLIPHKYPKWLILEVGVGKPGDMRRTASWLKTDAVIITGIGETPAHIEFFVSRKHLIEEKSKLIKTLKKPARNASHSEAGGDGLLILNADDPDVMAMKAGSKHRTITYGFKEGADIMGSEDIIAYDDESIPKGIIFRVDEGGNSLPVFIEGVFGRNHVYASLGALALASILKLNMLNAIETLKHYDISPGRMRLLSGIKESLIIDDTYNSSPFACASALKTFGEVKCTGRKIAILGDMLELGKHTEEAHKKIGKIAKENADMLVVVGHRAKFIQTGAIEAGMKKENIFEFLTSSECADFVKTFVQKGDLVLVKGSQSMRLERVVEVLLKDQENKNKLLVRQDEAWKRKE